MDAEAGQSADAVLLLEVVDAMAARRRRKVVLPPRFLPYVRYAVVAVVGLAIVGVLVWQVWPAVAARWKARSAATSPRKESNRSREGKAAETAAQTLFRLKRENETLRAENDRLREQLQRTSEALSQKTFELDEMKLRSLIREKTRPGQP